MTTEVKIEAVGAKLIYRFSVVTVLQLLNGCTTKDKFCYYLKTLELQRYQIIKSTSNGSKREFIC